MVEIFEQHDDIRTFFAELLLPVPIPRLFTYRVPRVMQESIRTGQRAIVPFGERKFVTGVITAIHEKAPSEYEAKYIEELLDTFPVVSDVQLRLFHWIASYYLCTTGEVLKAALPSGLKLSSESKVELHPTFSFEETPHSFTEKEALLLRALVGESMDYPAIATLLGVKNPFNVLKSLVAKGAIHPFEELREKYRPKIDRRIRLTPTYTAEKPLQVLFQSLATKPLQEAILLRYLQHVHVMQDSIANTAGISRKVLTDDPELSDSSIKTLVKNNIFEEFDVIVSRFPDEDTGDTPVIPLSALQQQAYQDILKSFATHDYTLLHGVTGSGKTEIYINLIRQALEGGSQVLYLLPEIALSTQIVHRLKKVFGTTLGVYHSRFSDAERVEVWNGVLSGRFKFVVGVRSSVLLPFDNLGLVIVDEEHDSSYKQQEPAPRYHARDVAMMMAHMHHAKVLLGSATPSVESYFQGQQGKYGLVTLDKRYGDAQLPQITLADIGRERRQKTLKGEFTSLLIRKIDETLQLKEQVILFQNRRGYSPMVNCEDCGWVPKCVNCAVSLTYHQYRNVLVCHHCGYKENMPQQCPSCTSARLKTVGYGTEKVEEEINLHFPNAQVQRMDLETTRAKMGYETIIDQFERGETDILVGTQMVTKGLDFDRVSLVGIFNADRLIHFPDFRSYERAFQLITQVSGRAGRRDKPGTVVVQTSNPEHPLLQLVLQHDYRGFYELQLADRQEHQYPPFSRLIEITLKHSDKRVCQQAAETLAEACRTKLPGVYILGPGEPAISKIRNLFLMNILIKVPRATANLGQLKTTLLSLTEGITQQKEFRSLRIILDVDPM
jgi:primosomal protein N' (replication factor Y) (superfamily II helicase)